MTAVSGWVYLSVGLKWVNDWVRVCCVSVDICEQCA